MKIGKNTEPIIAKTTRQIRMVSKIEAKFRTFLLQTI